jgi:S-adenosylmethionine:tRNA ribosyltransferase-isomerase
MQISDFDYSLPNELIAKHPPAVRGQSRLLVMDRTTGSIEHRKYYDVIDYLKPGDVVVLNDTKVIKARLEALNNKGSRRELLLLEKHHDDSDWHRHKALYRGQITPGEVLSIGQTEVTIEALESEGVAVLKSDQDLFELAEKVGSVPLPPYMKRQATVADVERYQTEFAKQPGSVAAPTASLNFTRELAEALKNKGIKVVYLTLHVGMGTFLPIRTDTLEGHKMHEEYFEIPASSVETIQAAKSADHKVMAVGTTVTRTLEFMSDQILNQPPQHLSGEADIFIYPGYRFQVVDQLLTNFHAPKSTVLMLTAAFAGWSKLKYAYGEAVKEHYALLSYGDSMLFL